MRKYVMKKIYSVIIVATTCSLSCMNEQKSRPALFSKNPYQISQQQQLSNLTVYVEANEPCWEIYDAIMDATYKSDNKNTDHTDLEPIYKIKNNITSSTKQKIAPEQKSFLSTIIEAKPHSNIMKKLYGQAYDFTWNNMSDEDTISIDLRKKELVDLIKNMREAYAMGIHEDMMGQFTYDEWSIYYRHLYIPLIFGCLKQYRLTTSQTQEPLPPAECITESDTLEDSVAQMFNIPHPTTAVINATSQSKNHINNYPAYRDLTYHLAQLFNAYSPFIITLNDYLYGEKNILTPPVQIYYDADCPSNFYQKIRAFMMNIHKHTAENFNLLHDLILTINTAKQKQEINSAKDLGYALLADKSTYFVDFLDSKNWIHYVRNYAALMCLLIEKYTETKQNKITPTPEQYICYKVKNNLNLILPESHHILLDEEIYALKEFTQLLNDIKQLSKTADQNTCQQIVDQLYDEKK